MTIEARLWLDEAAGFLFKTGKKMTILIRNPELAREPGGVLNASMHELRPAAPRRYFFFRVRCE